jgi:hypothetical protein
MSSWHRQNIAIEARAITESKTLKPSVIGGSEKFIS